MASLLDPAEGWATGGIILIVFLISEVSYKPLNKLVTLICLQFSWKIKLICEIKLNSWFLKISSNIQHKSNYKRCKN